MTASVIRKRTRLFMMYPPFKLDSSNIHSHVDGIRHYLMPVTLAEPPVDSYVLPLK